MAEGVSFLIGCITGIGGEFRYGYQRAAALGEWTLTKDEHGFMATGDILTSNFWLEQSPLKFTTVNGWRFPVQYLERMGARHFVARLGPVERKAYVPASATA